MDQKGNLYILLNVPARLTIYVFSPEGIFRGKLLGVKDSVDRITILDRGILYALSQDTHYIYGFRVDLETNL